MVRGITKMPTFRKKLIFDKPVVYCKIIHMSKRIKNFFTKIILFFLNFFGITVFVACNGKIIDIGGSSTVYGVPGNYFTVTGTITGDTNKDGKTEPVPNLKISVTTKTSNKIDYESEDPANGLLTTTQTDEKGNYTLEWNDMDSSNFNFTITVEDVDGNENGSFETKSFDENYSALSKNSKKNDFGNLIIKTTKNITLENENE